MSWVWIPVKNISIDNEVAYLKDKQKEGFRLVKRGLFFYRFEQTQEQFAGVGIDLVPRGLEADFYEIDGWTCQVVHRCFLSRYQKVYYEAQEESGAFMHDPESLLDFYAVAANRASNGAVVSLVAAALLVYVFFVLGHHVIGHDAASGQFIVQLPGAMVIAVVAWAIWLIKVASGYQTVMADLKRKMDIPHYKGFQKIYSVRMRKGLSVEKKSKINTTMESLGSHLVSSESVFVIRTNLMGEDVKQALLDLEEIQAGDFTIWNVAGRWSVQI